MAKVELTTEQLNEIIASAVKAAIDSARGPQPEVPGKAFEDATPDEQFHATMRERRGKHLPALPIKHVACKSNVTGATFNAEINDRGIVVGLPDYAYPPGIDISSDEGGLVPRGMNPIDTTTGRPNKLWLKWRWENFWQIDLRAFVNKPLPKYAQAEFADQMNASVAP